MDPRWQQGATAANFDDDELSGVYVSSVAERSLRLVPAPTERKRVKGLGDHPIHIGYDRAARLKAAPGMEEFYRDKQSKWARIVSCDERRRGGK